MRDVLRGGVLLLALVTLMACNAKEQAGAPKAKTVQTASEPASLSKQEQAKPAVAKPGIAKPGIAKPAKARLAKPGATKLTRTKPIAPKLTKVQKPGVAAHQEATAAPFTPAELPPVKAPSVDYPGFTGKRVAIVHTENIIGELEPCG